jgi:hypothetical protein
MHKMCKNVVSSWHALGYITVTWCFHSVMVLASWGGACFPSVAAAQWINTEAVLST